jgi:hypothetical protein
MSFTYNFTQIQNLIFNLVIQSEKIGRDFDVNESAAAERKCHTCNYVFFCVRTDSHIER